MHNRRAVAWSTFCTLCAIIPGCVGPPLVIAPADLANGAVGTQYSEPLTTDGVLPETWQVSSGSLPPGLSLTPDNGVLAGVPNSPGTFSFTVSAQDVSSPVRIGEITYSLTILARLTLDAALQPARVGEPYSFELGATGGIGSYQFEIIGLPAGLKFDATTGVISGTPLSRYDGLPLEITVTDAGPPQQTVTKRATLVVKPPPVSITTTELAEGRVGQWYSQPVLVADGTPPYGWSVSSGVLPDELRLNIYTGEIHGTPEDEAVGTATIVVTVTDDDTPPTTDSREFTITIEP